MHSIGLFIHSIFSPVFIEDNPNSAFIYYSLPPCIFLIFQLTQLFSGFYLHVPNSVFMIGLSVSRGTAILISTLSAQLFCLKLVLNLALIHILD